MGQEGGGKKKKKKTHRGGRGKGSSFVKGKLHLLDQQLILAKKRKQHRLERSTDPGSFTGGRVIVPQLPHDDVSGIGEANPAVVKYYRGIRPNAHPFLAHFDDGKDECTVARVDVRYDPVKGPAGSPNLCCVVGHLRREAPAPGCGIRIGKNLFIDYSEVPVDLGYHAFKPRLEVEQKPATCNFMRYMRRDPEQFNCLLWRDETCDKVVWVRQVKRLNRLEPIVLRDDPDFFVDGTAINKKEK